MSFTAYWKTTTGFNTTDYPVTIGKKLKECTIAELTAHCMCGSNSPFSNIAFTAKSSDLGTSSVIKDITGGVMFKEPITSSKSDVQVNEPANTGETASVYRRTIFIAHKSNVSIPQNAIDDTCSDDIYIVDDIKAPNKLVYNFTGASGLGTGDGGAITAKIGGYDLRHTCQKGQSAYSTAPNQVVYVDNTDANNPVTTYYGICLAFVYIVGDNAYITTDDHAGDFGFRYKNGDTSNQYNFLSGGNNYKSFKSANDYRLFIGANPNGTGRDATLSEIFPNCFADPVPNPAVFINTYYVTNMTTIPVQTVKFKFSLVNGTVGTSVESRTLQHTLSGETALESRMQQICRAGIYFVFDSQLWKPIIVGGVVVGYGTPEKVSEIDTYTDLNHPVPTGGGGGGGTGGGGDNEKDMPLHDFATSAGMVNYYLVDRHTAQRISDAISEINWQTIGRDLLPNMISYKIFATGTPNAGASRQISVGGVALEEQGQPVNGQPVTGFLSVSLGSFTIRETFGDFRDYAPFTKIEVYIPCCGWAQLPPWCMGKTVSGELFIDMPNGSCKAVLKSSRTVVAEIGGSCAVDIPFTATANGVKTANIISNIASGMTAAYNPTPQNIMSSAMGVLSAFNSNYTNVKGVNGDGSNLDGLWNVFVKVTRPASVDNDRNDLRPVTSAFLHEHGRPCGKQLTIAAGDGYTQVLDANIGGTMTAAEKQMIIDGFRHGLIISANPT